MLEFRINEYITLNIENEKTVIYLNGKEFIQCKRLILNIPTGEVKIQRGVKSIDDLEDFFSDSFEIDDDFFTPNEEFWAHCSNLQAWYENDYDTRFLHRNLAFPLLKALADAGDIRASQIFKEEIIHRISEGNSAVVFYLINEGFLKYLSEDELELIALDTKLHIIRNIILALDSLFREHEILADNIVAMIEKLAQNDEIRALLRKDIVELMNTGSDDVLVEIISYKLYKFIYPKDFKKLFKFPESKFFDNIGTILFRVDNYYSKNNGYIFSMLLLFFTEIHKKIGEDPLFKLIFSFKQAQRETLKLRFNAFLEGFSNLEFRKNIEREGITIKDFLNLSTVISRS